MPLCLNDVNAAVEINSGEGWQVLYPKHAVEVKPSSESISLRLREDHSVLSEVPLTQELRRCEELKASELGSFSLRAERWLEREQMSVALAAAQAELRKQRLNSNILKQHQKHTDAWRKQFVCLFVLAVFFLGCAVVLLRHVAPELMGVFWVFGCSLIALFMWTIDHRWLRPLFNLCGIFMTYFTVWSVFVVGVFGAYTYLKWNSCSEDTIVDVLVWWDFLPLCIIPFCLPAHAWFRHKKWAVKIYPDLLEEHARGQAVENSIVFHGRVLPGKQRPCVCSWPGKYESAWDAMVRSSETSAAVVFLPKGSELFGICDPIPAKEGLEGDCWCIPLYGEKKPWGCRWWTNWIENVDEAVKYGAKLQVYYFEHAIGKGKVKSFSALSQESLRRDSLAKRSKFVFEASEMFRQAQDAGIEELCKGQRQDGSSQYQREKHRLFLSWLCPEDRQFLLDSDGLGNSQKAEVAWLERRGYPYEEVDVSPWLRM
ncbi:hypothetical protein AK812_SmicGene11917 [Symbiodinium microadriaticum]|uniref:Uncharacterized protein n=1 Tax=Symbiodinium microadriaticum TaxID=2951 RepID=A0A1Q9EBX9_SYMMI|nr:hypothetical protein AK812_SmicGene11917 [Symbiodinium microadriaticum]